MSQVLRSSLYKKCLIGSLCNLASQLFNWSASHYYMSRYRAFNILASLSIILTILLDLLFAPQPLLITSDYVFLKIITCISGTEVVEGSTTDCKLFFEQQQLVLQRRWALCMNVSVSLPMHNSQLVCFRWHHRHKSSSPKKRSNQEQNPCNWKDGTCLHCAKVSFLLSELSNGAKIDLFCIGAYLVISSERLDDVGR